MRRGFEDIPGSLTPDRIPRDLDLNTIPFSEHAQSVLSDLLRSSIDDTALWRDHLCMTSQVRTFYSNGKIKQQWASYSKDRLPRDFKAGEPRISRPTSSTSWIDVPFTFVTSQNGGLIGNCSGIISFIPCQDGVGWKMWMLRTILENFEGCGHPDDPSPIFENLNTTANTNNGFEHEVSTLIIGAGQSGLSLAGRLGALKIPYLLLEKNKEIGYSWTGKYDGVRQHTVREMNNLPFDRTYKASDPDLLPAKTVAEGFRNYVRKYFINVWLGAEVDECLAGKGEIGWRVVVRKEGEQHVVKARHLALSLGAGLSVPKVPNVLNASSFKGTILDVGNFKNSLPWKSMKSVVVGSATAAHDGSSSRLPLFLNHLAGSPPPRHLQLDIDH